MGPEFGFNKGSRPEGSIVSLQHIAANCPIEDNVVWMHNMGGEFRVQNMYKTMLLSIYGKNLLTIENERFWLEIILKENSHKT